MFFMVNCSVAGARLQPAVGHTPSGTVGLTFIPVFQTRTNNPLPTPNKKNELPSQMDMTAV